MKKFTLPKIFTNKKTEIESKVDIATDSTVQSNQLSVSNGISIPSPGTKRFVLPKLSVGSSNGSIGSIGSSFGANGENLTPHETSIRKILDLRKLSISSPTNDVIDSIENVENSLETNRFVVDLTSALSESTNQVIKPIKPTTEQFAYKFFDCDAPKRWKNTGILLPQTNQICEINISNILNCPLKNRTKRTTAFGKVLCSKFRCTNLPYIKHEFKPKHSIEPFKFDKSNKLNQKNISK